MSNIIKLKRGKGEPTAEQLEDFTLGFDTENDIIYFNNEGLAVFTLTPTLLTALLTTKSNCSDNFLSDTSC